MEFFQRITEYSALVDAYAALKKGSRTPGVDRRTFEEYSKNLDGNLKNLSIKAKKNEYAPLPTLQYRMAKEKPGQFREIGISSLEDRVLQKSFVTVISQKAETFFSDDSYAYRPNRGHKKAIGRLINTINQNKNLFFALGDIHSFFDSIDHGKLINLFKDLISDEPELINLLELWLKNGAVAGKKYVDTNKGIKQGYIAAPLLSNIFLCRFDEKFKSCEKHHYFRYADNFIFACPEGEEYAKNIYAEAEKFLKNEMGLLLNPGDRYIVSRQDEFVFLGIKFHKGATTVADNKKESIVNEIKRIFSNNKTDPFLKTKAINSILSSYTYYYGSINNKKEFFQWVDEIVAKELSNLINSGTIDSTKAEKEFSSIVTLTQVPVFEIISTLKKPVINEKGNLPDPEKKISEQKRFFKTKLGLESECILLKQNMSLRNRQNKLILEFGEGRKREININNLTSVEVSSNNSTITVPVIKLCSEKNIPIYITDQFGNPVSQILPMNFFSMNITKYQIDSVFNGKAALIAKEIVTGKIKNQLATVKFFVKNKKDSGGLVAEVENMALKITQYIGEIEALEGADLPKLQSRILGYEGATAQIYWNIFKMICNDPTFESREHKNANHRINVMLNYGYGILYHRIYNAVIRARLNPGFSFLHREQKEKPTLVFDLIEQFRSPAVDRTVLSMLSRNFACPTDETGRLTHESRRKLSEAFLKRLHTYFKYGKSETSINELITKKTRELALYLAGEIPKYKSYSMKW